MALASTAHRSRLFYLTRRAFDPKSPPPETIREGFQWPLLPHSLWIFHACPDWSVLPYGKLILNKALLLSMIFPTRGSQWLHRWSSSLLPEQNFAHSAQLPLKISFLIVEFIFIFGVFEIWSYILPVVACDESVNYFWFSFLVLMFLTISGLNMLNTTGGHVLLTPSIQIE